MPTWTNPGATFQTGTLEPGRPMSTTAYATYVKDNLTYLHDALILAPPTLTYGTATALTPGAVQANGSAGTVVVRSDHVHGGQGAWPILVQSAGATVATVTALNFTSATVTVDVSATGAVNVTTAKRVIPYQTQSGGALYNSNVNDAGLSGGVLGELVSRSDHRHGRETFAIPPALTPASVTTEGYRTPSSAGGWATSTIARGDHQHGLASRWPVTVWVNGSAVPNGTQDTINLIAGQNIQLGLAYDATVDANVATIIGSGPQVAIPMTLSGSGGAIRNQINFWNSFWTGISVTTVDTSRNDVLIEFYPNITYGTASTDITLGYYGGGNLSTVGESSSQLLPSRADHSHYVDTTSSYLVSTNSNDITTIAPGDTNVSTIPGAAGILLARSDHRHGLPRIYGVRVRANGGAMSVATKLNWVSANSDLAITAVDDPATTSTLVTFTGSSSLVGHGEDLIATMTVSVPNSQQALSFLTIPTGYTHLVIRACDLTFSEDARSGPAVPRFLINGGALAAWRTITDTPSATSLATLESSFALPRVASGANWKPSGVYMITLYDYTDTASYKYVDVTSNGPDTVRGHYGRNDVPATKGITITSVSMTIAGASGNSTAPVYWGVGSTFMLYGIK